MKVASVSQMREMDRAAIQQYGMSDEILMENAAHGAYSVLSRQIGVSGKKFVVLCGPGNNGGDGFVVARKIHSDGGIKNRRTLRLTPRFRWCSPSNIL